MEFLENNHVAIRGISYVLILFFYMGWGIYSLFLGLYHRAVIKLLTSAVLLAAFHYAMSGNPNIVVYLSTPLAAALALAVSTFVIRLLRSVYK